MQSLARKLSIWSGTALIDSIEVAELWHVLNLSGSLVCYDHTS